MDVLVPEAVIRLLMEKGQMDYKEVITILYWFPDNDSIFGIQADRVSRLFSIEEKIAFAKMLIITAKL